MLIEDAPMTFNVSAAAAASIAIPICTAIGAAAKFGWSALFSYLGERDRAKNDLFAQITGELTTLAGQIAMLCKRVEDVDQGNRTDQRANNEKLIAAMTDTARAMAVNTQVTQQATDAMGRLANKFGSDLIPGKLLDAPDK